MAFDDKTRNRLNSFVTQARELLTKEFTQQCQVDFGLNPKTGEIKDLASLRFDEEKRQTAIILRETIAHYYANLPTKSKKTETDNKVLIERVIREQAFTILNRLCAVRMAEARDLIIESVAKGVQSKGFQLYQHVVGPSVGDTGAAYEQYLFSLFDEFAIDLAVLFDRFSPQGRLFPRDTVLMELLGLINNPEINHLWAEDETIGWIYQYFNSKEERKAMRDASQAPRNSRELAVRNQFFTPRYVVEFLTDNTLGRIWYEMRQGNMPWVDDCKYLVRRPDEVFLAESTSTEAEFVQDGVVAAAKQLQSGTEDDYPEFSASTDDEIQRMIDLAHTVSAYTTLGDQAHELLSDSPSPLPADRALKLEEGFLASPTEAAIAVKSGEFTRTTTQQILNTLFMTCRNDRHGGDGSVYKEPWFVDACNEVRRRILHSRESDLSQEEMLRAPVLMPYRPLKDPRDLRMLDPACGSMHFGLYAFDLYLKIYDEYWDLCHDSSFRAPTTERRLPTEEYADKAAWMKAAPKLIIEHNIHGIDIDARAVQIAGLSLWLRAQRAWKSQGIAAGDRPQVTRSNVVCAEPMPGDQQQLAAFCKSLHPAIAQMVTAIFEEMKLAGEAGSLLKIEQEIKKLVAAAKQQWQQQPKETQLELFGGAEVVKEQQLEFDLSGITDEQFFEKAEEEIYATLRKYASETSEGSFRKKLFAGDAAKGFAFIELCQQRFDVSLMNPPFGELAERTKSYINKYYSTTKSDLYTCFVDRTIHMSEVVGVISNRTFLNLSTHEKFRSKCLIGDGMLDILADLGSNVLDAMVEVAAYVVSHNGSLQMPRFFFPVADTDAKAQALARLVRDKSGVLRALSDFQSLPTQSIAYWLPDVITQHYRSGITVEGNAAEVRVGIQTSGDERFARLKWEVPSVEIGQSRTWAPFAKGGEYSPYYYDVHLVVKHAENFRENVAYTNAKYPYLNGNARSLLHADVRHYFSIGLTYPWRTSLGFAPRVLPAGCVFAAQGSAMVPVSNSQSPERDLLVLLGALNSDVFQKFISIGVGATDGAARSYQVGMVQQLPWRAISQPDTLVESVSNCVNRRRFFDVVDETTCLFVRPWLANGTVEERFDNVVSEFDSAVRDFMSSYGLVESIIRAEFKIEMDEDTSEVVESSMRSRIPSRRRFAEALLSYFFGIVCGRWKLKKGANEASIQNLPPVFDEIDFSAPAKSEDPAGDAIFVEDATTSQSISTQVKLLIANEFGGYSDDAEAFIVSELECGSLGKYLRQPNGFFAQHLSTYSKSRRSAPIYWPISTESGSYTLWFYYHRLTDQTLYKAVNDFVDPKLKQTTRQLAELRAIKDRTSSQEKELAQLTELESELEQFKADLLEIAAFWKPNLNDGVQITAAPLWKFFRLQKWRNKLKTTWEELESGKYDWAHLALSIWPDRVVKEAAHNDRSIAIAHDLEDQLWHEVEVKKTSKRGRVTTKTEWQPRNLSDAELDAIVAKVKAR